MPFIQINNLSFTYPTLEKTLFHDINLTFSEGWCALIGPNGSGKTTLLNLIAKNINSDSGSIIKSESIYLCKQENSKDIPELFYDPDLINLPKTIQLLGKLDIKDEWLFRWEELSGGEKKRCMIADALARDPQILLVDEPINHLDTYSIDLLSKELKKFDGIGIIISHDLAFLDSLCQKTLIIEPNGNSNSLIYFDTPPSQALREREKTIEYYRKEKDKEYNKLKKIKNLRSIQLEKVQNSKSRLSKKNIDVKDHSTKAKIDGARLTSKDKKVSKKVSSYNKLIEKSATKIQSINTLNKQKTHITLANVKDPKTLLFSLDKGETTLIENELTLVHPSLFIKNDSRIIISGNNGSGKTSFLEYLTQKLNKGEKHYYYLKQSYSELDRIKIKKQFLSFDKTKQADILSTVFRLGSNPKSVLLSEIPSPGETQKLLYAIAIIEKAYLLILDEPTNYLDILSISSLIEALNEYSGAIISVTHDRYFATNIGHETWNFKKHNNKTTIEILPTDVNKLIK